MVNVTVIIPNYNGEKFLRPCLDALRKQTSREFETLVVENASSDGSREILREYPEVKVLFMEKNEGFDGGVNAGIRASKTPYVILLNNDTAAEPGFVEALTEAISGNERIFSVSSQMIQMYQREKIDDAGDMYSLLGWAYQRGVDRPVSEYNKPCQVFSACAGAAIYRRKVFEQIGYFDEMHFAYLEDIDIGYRARIYGYENWYCPKAKVYHVGSGTSGSKYNDFKVRLAARNNVYLNYKNMPLFQRGLNYPFLKVGQAVKARFFEKKGFGRIYRQGIAEGMRTRKSCRKVPFSPGNLWNYMKIEGWLIKGTFLYVKEFSRRHIKKNLEKKS